MPQDEDDLVYRKDLSEERIEELKKTADAYRYNQNCITAAFAGAIIAFFAALLFGVSLGLTCLIIAALGAGAGYAFYAWGKYVEEKHKNDSPLESPLPDDIDKDDIDKIDKSEPVKEAPKSQPLCIGCLEPIDPLAYYCPKCGYASNQLTPYIPFVNIRFNYSIFGRLWHNLWYEKTSLPMKIISAALIILTVPIMLVGLPFVIWDKSSRHKKQSDPPPQDKQESEDE